MRVRNDASAGQQTYPAGLVAQTLGIPTATLRSWHHRYGVAPHADSPGGYRRYLAEDIARLEHMRDLVRSGALASDAARMTMARHGTGIEVLLSRLVDASKSLDSARCGEILDETLRVFGAVASWELLCCQAIRRIDAHSASALCIPQQHVLSQAIAAAMCNHTAVVTHDSRTMLACADGEQHTLPLEVLRAALAERGAAVTMLGASVPHAGMVEAARALSPRMIVVWAQRKEAANRDLVHGLRRFSSCVVTAGPGWSSKRHLTTLEGAVAALTGTSVVL